jgi:5-methylcytosine-specific restriction endonuclease McrA
MRWDTRAYRRNRAALLADPDVHTCYVCGKPVDKELPGSHEDGPTAEHKVPRAVALRLGWTPEQINDRSNLALSHRRCNNRRQAGDASLFRRPPSPWD